MSVSNKFLAGTRSDKSDNVEHDLPYFDLSRFDTRNSNVDKDTNNKNSNAQEINAMNSNTHNNKPHDPDGVLKGQPMLKCNFCDEYKTQIEFDLELHLYEMHKWELLTKLPFKGKGYSMDYRIAYVIGTI